MAHAEFDDVTIHYLDEGVADRPALVLVHSLGLSLRLWDKLVQLLSDHYRIVRMDLRGHGQSSVPPAPYSLGRLTRDLERLIEHLALDRPVVAGISVGGLVAQALAAKRGDLLRGAILCATGLKIGTRQSWDGRVEAVRSGGMAKLAPEIAARWFNAGVLDEAEAALWRDRLADCSPEGYIGTCVALGGADLIATSSVLHLPVLAVAASLDLVTPPDLVREMADLIPHARFELIRRAGHLFPLEQPEATAQLFDEFLSKTKDLRTT